MRATPPTRIATLFPPLRCTFMPPRRRLAHRTASNRWEKTGTQAAYSSFFEYCSATPCNLSPVSQYVGRWCQTNANQAQEWNFRHPLMRAKLPPLARVAARLALKVCRLERLRSRLKWLQTAEWKETNFCTVPCFRTTVSPSLVIEVAGANSRRECSPSDRSPGDPRPRYHEGRRHTSAASQLQTDQPRRVTSAFS